MNKKEFKTIAFLLKDFASGHKGVMAAMAVLSVSKGIRPYVAVILTGLLVDAAYQGAPFGTLVRYVLCGTGVNAAFMLLESFTERAFNRKLEYTFEIQNRTLNKKSMEMDYEYLEDSKIHEERQQMNSRWTRFGYVGQALSHISAIIGSFCACVASLVIVLPMIFVEDRAAYGWVGSPLLSVLFFVLLGVFVYGSYKVMAYYHVKQNQIWEGPFMPLETHRKFYMDLLAAAEPQKDLRLYGQQGLIRDEVERIVAEEKKSGARRAFI